VPAPNFLIIGAPKSGTTALFKYLQQHPQVFMSPLKEPRFLAYDHVQPAMHTGPGDQLFIEQIVKRWEDYLQLFAAAPATAAAIGEASPIYIYAPAAPARIQRYVPQARLIALLRQPVDRAYSHYQMLRRNGREPARDFREALRREDERVRLGWGPTWHYRRRGDYAPQLERYLARFPRTQLRIYLHDDLHANGPRVLRDIFEFLEIDPAFTPDLRQRYNEGGLVHSSALYAFLHQPHRIKDLVRPLFPKPLADRLWLGLRAANRFKTALDPQLRAELTEECRPGILRLQDLLGRDLSPWLKA
jgi:hypothetical protein